MLNPALTLEARVCGALRSDGNNSTVTVELPVLGSVGRPAVSIQRSGPRVYVAKGRRSASASTPIGCVFRLLTRLESDHKNRSALPVAGDADAALIFLYQVATQSQAQTLAACAFVVVNRFRALERVEDMRQ